MKAIADAGSSLEGVGWDVIFWLLIIAALWWLVASNIRSARQRRCRHVMRVIDHVDGRAVWRCYSCPHEEIH